MAVALAAAFTASCCAATEWACSPAESAFLSTMDHNKIGVRRSFLAILLGDLGDFARDGFCSGPALRYMRAMLVSLGQANFTQRRQAAKKLFVRFSGSLRETNTSRRSEAKPR